MNMIKRNNNINLDIKENLPPKFFKELFPNSYLINTILDLKYQLEKKRGLDKYQYYSSNNNSNDKYIWDLNDSFEYRYCIQWLQNLVKFSTQATVNLDNPENNENNNNNNWTWENLIDEIIVLISEICGKGASGPVFRNINLWNKDISKEFNIILYESSFIESDVGCQTWGSSILFSRKLAREEIKLQSDIDNNLNILELGSGTGLCGITLAIINSNNKQNLNINLVMTDYLPPILNSINKSLEANKNEISQNIAIKVKYLDWFKVPTTNTIPNNNNNDNDKDNEINDNANIITSETLPNNNDSNNSNNSNNNNNSDIPYTNYIDVLEKSSQFNNINLNLVNQTLNYKENYHKFDIIIASDILYEIQHSKQIPKLIDYFLNINIDLNNIVPKAIIISPLRFTHKKEIEIFELKMKELNFNLETMEVTTLKNDLNNWINKISTDFAIDKNDLFKKIIQQQQDNDDNDDDMEYILWIWTRH